MDTNQTGILDNKHRQAAWAIILLGAALLVALTPFASGLLGAPILYSITVPIHRWMARRIPAWMAAVLVILLTITLVVIPSIWLVGQLVNQAQQAIAGLTNSPLLERLTGLHFGPIDVGSQLVEAGRQLLRWLGTNAIGLVGTAARLFLNLTFAFFGLYFLLLHPEGAWRGVRPWIPFSDESAELLRQRFHAVTTSTVIGTGLTAIIQGALLAVAFQVLGLGNALFWGTVTAIFAVLPVVGSGLVWGPAAISLIISNNYAAAAGMIGWGAIVVGSVDNVIRPLVYNRYAKIHPMITLVGAIVGVGYFGIAGLLLGPLAISYFFELLRLYRAEYGTQVGLSGDFAVIPAPSEPPDGNPGEDEQGPAHGVDGVAGDGAPHDEG